MRRAQSQYESKMVPLDVLSAQRRVVPAVDRMRIIRATDDTFEGSDLQKRMHVASEALLPSLRRQAMCSAAPLQFAIKACFAGAFLGGHETLDSAKRGLGHAWRELMRETSECLVPPRLIEALQGARQALILANTTTETSWDLLLAECLPSLDIALIIGGPRFHCTRRIQRQTAADVVICKSPQWSTFVRCELGRPLLCNIDASPWRIAGAAPVIRITEPIAPTMACA